jgi:hypothetical protein
MVDPHTPLGGYNFCRGYLNNGNEWEDPSQNRAPTTFPFSGDPVTGTGWLFEDITTPRDIRMGCASGPFDLAIGESQDIVVGLVVGVGPDPLSSITVMRHYDAIAQNLYDKNFELASPPQPELTASGLNGHIVLTWDNGAMHFDEGGYAFEGYNVWQGETETGPWTRIATFDKVNGIARIRDMEYVPFLGEMVEHTVQWGADSGLDFKMIIEDDVLNEKAIINGRPYYFALSAYAYSADATPKTVETAKSTVTVIPQQPVLETAFHAAIGDTLDFAVSGQKNDGVLLPIIVDPSALTGHEYGVEIDTTAAGEWVWHLTDQTTGEIRLEDQSNFSGDNGFAVVDGVQVKLAATTADEFGLNLEKGAYANYGSPYGGGWDWRGDRWITGVNFGGRVFWGGLFIGANAFWGTTLGPMDYVDVRIDFWNDANHAADATAYPWSECATYDRTRNYVYNGTGTFPGAAYDVDDPANPRRINLTFVEYSLVDHHWDPVAADDGEGTGGREYLFINKTDYDGGISYDGINDGRYTDVLYMITAKQRGTYTSSEEFRMYIYCLHPVTTENAFAYTTAGLEPTQTGATAQSRLDEINVFPNPYFGYNNITAVGERQHVKFINLPSECTIRVFSLSGQLIRTILHDNGTPFDRWDLLNENGHFASSGMYIIHIETEYGNRILKLGIVQGSMW